MGHICARQGKMLSYRCRYELPGIFRRLLETMAFRSVPIQVRTATRRIRYVQSSNSIARIAELVRCQLSHPLGSKPERSSQDRAAQREVLDRSIAVLPERQIAIAQGEVSIANMVTEANISLPRQGDTGAPYIEIK